MPRRKKKQRWIQDDNELDKLTNLSDSEEGSLHDLDENGTHERQQLLHDNNNNNNNNNSNINHHSNFSSSSQIEFRDRAPFDGITSEKELETDTEGDDDQSEKYKNSNCFWRWLRIAGPGLVVMLADTDAGCLITAGQSGALWGYSLVLLQLLLVPVVYIAQELTIRLGIFTHMGLGELIMHEYGKRWAWFACVLMVLICTGAVVTEISGVVGVGQVVGVPEWASIAISLTVLFLMILTGAYQRIEKIALFFGFFELVFVVTMIKSSPDPSEFAEGLGTMPLENGSYLYLIAANIGAVVMPWMIFYQQSAVVERNIKPDDLLYMRIDTIIGAFLTQLIMIAVLVTCAATLWDGNFPSNSALETIPEFSNALTPHLGETNGTVLFSLGMIGGALIGAVVVTLTATWTMGEVTGFGRSLSDHPLDAPWVYAVYVIVLACGAFINSLPIDMVAMNVSVQVMNAVLLPVVLVFLFNLARTALPEEHRLKGWYMWLVGTIFTVCSVVGVVAALYGVYTGNAA